MNEKEIDDVSGVETTGHEWDGIKELNNPLPRWWLWTFYACIIWALGYTILYPAWPLVSSTTQGVLGYSSRGDFTKKMDLAKQEQSVFFNRIAEQDVGDIVADEELARFARAGGQSAFKVNCSQCHGSGAQGTVGSPNLNDDEWIWGGTIEAIYATIAHGVRFTGDDNTRSGEMPAFGADEILNRAEILSIANYVVSISGGAADAAKVDDGAILFADNCAACHGESAQGEAELGSPPLNNAIWLYGDGSVNAIVTQIGTPSHGIMPAWSAKLGDTAVKQLAVYVHGLGGGE